MNQNHTIGVLEICLTLIYSAQLPNVFSVMDIMYISDIYRISFIFLSNMLFRHIFRHSQLYLQIFIRANFQLENKAAVKFLSRSMTATIRKYIQSHLLVNFYFSSLEYLKHIFLSDFAACSFPRLTFKGTLVIRQTYL